MLVGQEAGDAATRGLLSRPQKRLLLVVSDDERDEEVVVVVDVEKVELLVDAWLA